jgi:hypothetical protein
VTAKVIALVAGEDNQASIKAFISPMTGKEVLAELLAEFVEGREHEAKIKKQQKTQTEKISKEDGEAKGDSTTGNEER